MFRITHHLKIFLRKPDDKKEPRDHAALAS
jgi:hypothetical protein